jgi:hypothetical protein
MARLSGIRASAESEEQSVSAEGVADSEEEEEEEEEGAMEEHNTTPKRRRLNGDARHPNGNASRTSQQGAMGQAESRDTLRKRNAALHRAGQEAREYKGKLKRLSGGPSHALSARRVPLSNARTFDVPDRDEEGVLSNNARHTPLRRTIKRTQIPSRRSPEQSLIDQQFIDDQLTAEADKEDEDVERDEDEAASEGHEEEEHVVEQPQQSGNGKKRRGRPRNEPLQPIQTNGQTGRVQGWVLNQSHPDNQRREQPSTSAVQSPEANAAPADPVTPDTTAAPKRKRGRPTKEQAAAAAARASVIARKSLNSDAQVNRRRSARVSGDNVESATEPAVPAASTSNANRLRNKVNQAATSNGGKRASARVNNHSDAQQQATEEMGSVAQPVVLDDEEYDDQAHDTNEEAEEDDEDHVPEGNDEAEERPEPSNTDSQRLHGQWGQMRGILREALKHRDETPNIPDDTFNETLRACKDVRRTVRATAIDIGPDELERITSECESAVSRAGALCRDTKNVPNRDDRGYHIFKFLVPSLAKLLKSVIEAFERVDIEGAGLPQISMAHLLIVINLISAIHDCGNGAYHAYTALDPGRPVKKDVHAEITIKLRDLSANLTNVYQRRVGTETARVQAEAMHDEYEARNQQRERLEEWRKTKMQNLLKWKKMDTVRRQLIHNSRNEKRRAHIYKCPSTLVVETGEDGRPFIPVKWRKEVVTFTMRELEALREGLMKHADTPDPLKSEVFENLMLEYCRFGGELSERNTLEIVRQACDMRAGLIHMHRKRDIDPPGWVWRVPVWIEPVRY